MRTPFKKWSGVPWGSAKFQGCLATLGPLAPENQAGPNHYGTAGQMWDDPQFCKPIWVFLPMFPIL